MSCSDHRRFRISAEPPVTSTHAVADAMPVVGNAVHHPVVFDQMDEASLNSGFDAAVAGAGRINIVINNGLQGHPVALTTITASRRGHPNRLPKRWFTDPIRAIVETLGNE
jgi:hypothetical protein